MYLFASTLMDISAARKDDRVVLLSDYLQRAESEDAGIALAILAAERPVARPSPQRLRNFALTGLSENDLDRAKDAGADLLETLCLLFPTGQLRNGTPLSALPLLSRPSSSIDNDDLTELFGALPVADRYALGEILSGRAGRLMSIPDLWRALARAFELEPEHVAPLWFVDEAPYRNLVTRLRGAHEFSDVADRILPRHFCAIGEREATSPFPDIGECFFAEEAIGHRVQIVAGPSAMIVDAGGRRLTRQFPEIVEEMRNCSAALLEGMIVPTDACSDPEKSLGRRLNATKGMNTLLRQHPVLFQVHDFWREGAIDLSLRNYTDRKSVLENWLEIHQPNCATVWACQTGTAPARAGLLVRDGSSTDIMWRTINPRKTAFGVLLYVKTTRGRVISKLTLGVRDGDDLVPIGDVDPVLEEEAHHQLLQWARKNARERFGPVISVPAEHVIEFTYRGVLPAPRRKSGLQLLDMTFGRFCRSSGLDQVVELSSFCDFPD